MPPATNLTALIAEVKRVADALVDANTQVASVIGTDTNGDSRVRTDPDTP